MFGKKKNEDYVLIMLLTIILLMVLYSLSRLLALQKRVYELEMSQVDEKSTKELIHEEMGNAVSGIRKEISTRLMPSQNPQIPMPPAAKVDTLVKEVAVPVVPTVAPVVAEKPVVPSVPLAPVVAEKPVVPLVPSLLVEPEGPVAELPTVTVPEVLPTPVVTGFIAGPLNLEVSSTWQAETQWVAEDKLNKNSVAPMLEPITLEVNPPKKKTGKKPKNGGVEVQLG